MKKTFSKPPAGYSTVCPFLMVESIEMEIAFLAEIFQAEIKEQLKGPDDKLQHAEVRIGECVIMMGRRMKNFPDQGMTYVFVEDTDLIFKKAISNGAIALMEPADRFYGLREGGFSDPQGNQWWIASLIEEMSLEEMQRRAASAAGFQP